LHSERQEDSSLLLTAETPKCPREHGHQQAPGSQNEHFGDATDMELSKVAHKQKYSTARLTEAQSALRYAVHRDGNRAVEDPSHRSRFTSIFGSCSIMPPYS